ncbi:polyprenyl synthetase family protein [Pirellula sp. SH-Sr6A]|uniref:polyprenyl synthetase family protein n=1 Tax=Pirellula sp. SH-Sr6A TaxID=1632865 RepID=UPI0011BA694D
MTPIADSSAAQPDLSGTVNATVSESPKADKKTRRKTSHLKLVPETKELRTSLRDKCREVAARLNKDLPPTKDELEQIARRTLEEAGLPEGYLGWAMVILSSEFFRDSVASIPPSRRLFLLPHCLKHAEGCPADYDEFGMDCKKCGACSIADFRTKAEEMGYKVLVAEGSPVVMKIIVSGYVDSIVGVACLNVLEKAIDKILLAGIPCMAVPLLSSDCRNTSVDEDWVQEMILTQGPALESQTRSYVHLMRAASDLFSQPKLNELVGRQRSQVHLDPNSDAPLAGIDPIAATEALATDFLARGGKYSRPFITLAAYDAMTGGQATTSSGPRIVEQFTKGVQCAAMSIECFHKASLVHDDIEDNDAYRYGMPAMHQQFGLSTAINVGDYMIGLGYRLIGRETQSIGPEAAADILNCLSSAHMRLAEGQGAELLWRDGTDKRLAPLDALKIYALKTAPAFEAALYTGIRLATDAAPYAEAVKLFARNIGVAFQIINDLQDWHGDDHNKLAAAGDILGGRPTVLLALALQSLSPADQQKLLDAMGGQDGMSDSYRIATARELLEKARVFEQAEKLIEKHRERALDAAQSIELEALRRLMLYLIDTVLDQSGLQSSPAVHSPQPPAEIHTYQIGIAPAR